MAGLTFLSGSLRVGMTAIILFFTLGLLLVWLIPTSAENAPEEAGKNRRRGTDRVVVGHASR